MESKHEFEQIYRLLQFQPREVAFEVFQRIRKHPDVASVVRFVHYGALRYQLGLVPRIALRLTPCYLDDIKPLSESINNPYLGSRLHEFVGGSTKPRDEAPENTPSPSQSKLQMPFPGARLFDSRFTKRTLGLSKWTSISSDESFLHSLLESYFLYEFSFWPCLHKETFLRALAEEDETFCSKFLVNVILTAGCVSR